MKHVPILSAVLLGVALLGAQRADAISAEQPLNISFTGLYQGPTKVSNGVETKTSQTVAITTATIVRAIAFDLGDTAFTTWRGASLLFVTDLSPSPTNGVVRRMILRKGTNTQDVTSFFTPTNDVSGFFTTPSFPGPLQIDNRIANIRLATDPLSGVVYFASIVETGLETIQLSTTNLKFSMTGFATGNIITPHKNILTNRVSLTNIVTTMRTLQTNDSVVVTNTVSVTNSVPVTNIVTVTLSAKVELLRVPSASLDIGPGATGSFIYNTANASAPASFVTGPARNGVFSLHVPVLTN